jgi:sarcosine oxidase
LARFDVAVIGLGAMGSAALYHLARAGRRVVGIEQATPGHDGGSSHGDSRIIRLAHYENPAYTPLVRRAWRLWLELEEAGGETVIVPTGILEAGPPGAAIVEGSLAAAREHDLAHEVLTPAEANWRFPAFNLPAGWTVLFQPGAGIVRADVAVRLHVVLAREAGAVVRVGERVTAVEAGAHGVALRTAGGETLEADRVVVTAGAWIADLVPALAGRLTVTRQPLAWFAPTRPADVTPARMPVFLVEDADDAIYGFPDFMGAGVKAASHVLGRALEHADAARQDATAADAAPIARALGRLVPGAAGPVKALKTCLYTSTADEEFIIDFADADHRIAYASACSGHGFKFASAFGELLAGMTQSGEVPPAFSAFRLSRFAAT